MEWTFANLIIQTVAGLIGSNIAAAAAHEHRFGFWRHSLVGLASGALGGLALQKYASTMVTASGSLNEPTHVQVIASQALTGAVIGAISMMTIGLIIKERSKGN
jgi:zinc transporter ZupT